MLFVLIRRIRLFLIVFNKFYLNIIKKTSYLDACIMLQKDLNSLIRVDDDAFTKVYIYLTNSIHVNIRNKNPSIENPYSLLYKLNKL